MDTGSYSYKTLKSKYDGFMAPALEVTIGSKTFKSNEIIIQYLEVNLTAEGSAGGCTLMFDGQYNTEESSWLEKLDKVIKLGEKLSVKGGYVKKQEIFYGYIDDFTFSYNGEESPKIEVTGIDGLGYLMSLHEPIYAGQKKAAEVVKSILQKSVTAGFAKSVKVGTLSGFETPIVKEDIDDWKFLNLMAQRYNVNLFAINGELIFDDVAASTKPILTLTVNGGLRSFRKRVSLAQQVGKVEIRGHDVNQKPIMGTADTVSTSDSGKSAAKLVSSMKSTTLREYNEFVRTEAECKLMAQNRLDEIAMGLVSGEGSCVGIPEIIPGRYIEIDGLASSSNGTYFITKVTHRFDDQGYSTTFEVKGAKTE